MSETSFQFRISNLNGIYETSRIDHRSLLRDHASDLRLYGCGESVSDNGAVTQPDVFYSYWGIEYIAEGEGTLETENAKKHIGKGDVVLCPPGRAFKLKAGKGIRMKKHWLLIANDPLAEYLGMEITNHFQEFLLHPGSPERIGEIFRSIRELAANGHPRLHQELSDRIYMLLNELRQYAPRRMKKTRFDRILSLVSRSPQNFPDVGSLAEAFGMPVQSLFRTFRERLGCPPMQYVIRCRIYNSCWELSRHEIPVSAVAEMYGYRDTAFYIREFKKQLGMTPLQYRKAFQNGLPLPTVLPEAKTP